MVTNYLLLVALVLATIGAIGSMVGFSALLIHWSKLKVAQDDRSEKIRKYGPLIAGIIFIVCAIIAYRIYGYLATNASYVLKEFALWYSIGFVSRMILLYYWREIFDPVLHTDTDAVFEVFFRAFLGPIETILVIWTVLTKKYPLL